MTVEKKTPWTDGDARIFRLSASEVQEVISLRQEFDHEGGNRFRGEAIRRRGWVVGLVAREQLPLNWTVHRHLGELQSAGVEQLYAIPATNARSEETGTHDVEAFEPPLVAKISPTLDDYALLLRSKIPRMNGSFYLFPSTLQSAVLVNTRQCAMYAGPAGFVESVLGMPVAESWRPISHSWHFNPDFVRRLRDAREAYLRVAMEE